MHDVLYLAGICYNAVDNSLPKQRLAGLLYSQSWFNAGGLIQGEKQNRPREDKADGCGKAGGSASS